MSSDLPSKPILQLLPPKVKGSAAERSHRKFHCASARLQSLFPEEQLTELLSQGQDYVRRRRVLDFLIVPGSISAKVQEENKKPFSTVITLPQFSEADWETVFSVLAEKALFLAQLLSGDLSETLFKTLDILNLPLLPRTSEEFSFSCECDELTKPCSHIGALLFLFCDRLEHQPLNSFLLRGKGKDECILQIREFRNNLKTSNPITQDKPNSVTVEAKSYVLKSPETFFSYPTPLEKISYDIRADELPASILRRLDPLPLGGLEEEIEYQLEECYAQVARRAQAYGLGLNKK